MSPVLTYGNTVYERRAHFDAQTQSIKKALSEHQATLKNGCAAQNIEGMLANHTLSEIYHIALARPGKPNLLIN